MYEGPMACRHLGQFFQLAIEFNLDQADFTLKALNSEYKKGIEIYKPQWYSQSQYYYFDEFLDENKVNKRLYKQEEIVYEKERMYWLGYCLQDWSNRAHISGIDIAKMLGIRGVNHLLKNYKVYHTVDAMYVLEDCKDYLGIKDE